MTTWHGNPQLKTQALETMTRHRTADEIIQGSYLQTNSSNKYRGCFHGCLTAETLAAEAGLTVLQFADTINDHEDDINWHDEGERIWGIPAHIGNILETIFESMIDPAEAADFALNAIQAIPVGADLTHVTDHWILDILIDPAHGVRSHADPDSAGYALINAVADLYRRRIEGDEPTRGQWENVSDTARDIMDRLTQFDMYGNLRAVDVAAVARLAADRDVSETAYRAGNVASVVDARRWQVERMLHHLSTAPVVAS